MARISTKKLTASARVSINKKRKLAKTGPKTEMKESVKKETTKVVATPAVAKKKMTAVAMSIAPKKVSGSVLVKRAAASAVAKIKERKKEDTQVAAPDVQSRIEGLENLVIEMSHKNNGASAPSADMHFVPNYGDTQPKEPQSIEKLSEELKRVKMDVIDVNNNVFQVHKAAKDVGSIIEARINQLFVKIALIIIIVAIIMAFVMIWMQTNP